MIPKIPKNLVSKLPNFDEEAFDDLLNMTDAVFVQSSVFTAKLRNTEFLNFQLRISYVFLSKTLYFFPTEQNGTIGSPSTERRVITVYTLTLSDIICTIIQLAASLSVQINKVYIFVRLLGYFQFFLKDVFCNKYLGLATY